MTEITLGRTKLALSDRNGVFGVISGVCNHGGGPLGQGKLDGNYVACPWHNWKFHRVTGIGEPGSADVAVPSYKVKVKGGRVRVRMLNRPRYVVLCNFDEFWSYRFRSDFDASKHKFTLASPPKRS